MKSAVVLLSGGIDSTVTAYIARQDIGKRGILYALSFNYGQRHDRELAKAAMTSGVLKVARHHIVVVYIPADSPLTGQGDIPDEREKEGEVAVTWVPQRNSIFLALAFAYAETVEADFVYAGFNAVDYSGYPDCRPEFVSQMEKALNLASKRFVESGRGIGIITPIMKLSKVDIIKKGLELNVDFRSTWSCYKGEEKPCLVCPSCRIRNDAFHKLGMEDPLNA
jgi:7-cyano-7-deazaguanine synthase